MQDQRQPVPEQPAKGMGVGAGIWVLCAVLTLRSIWCKLKTFPWLLIGQKGLGTLASTAATKMLMCWIFSLTAVIPTLGFTAPQGVASSLKGWQKILRTICSKQKTNMQNTAVLSAFGGGQAKGCETQTSKLSVTLQKLGLAALENKKRSHKDRLLAVLWSSAQGSVQNQPYKIKKHTHTLLLYFLFCRK